MKIQARTYGGSVTSLRRLPAAWGWPGMDIGFYASPMHDIGKIAVSDLILYKPTAQTNKSG